MFQTIMRMIVGGWLVQMLMRAGILFSGAAVVSVGLTVVAAVR